MGSLSKTTVLRTLCHFFTKRRSGVSFQLSKKSNTLFSFYNVDIFIHNIFLTMKLNFHTNDRKNKQTKKKSTVKSNL